MNEKEELTTLIQSLKTHLAENEGEMVYWGEKNEVHLSKSAQLGILRDKTIGDCHLCPLGDTRIKLVFGVGNPDARVMFIGEGPGFDEDRQGEPFVGKAGQLLDRIMSSIGLSRSTVYIANIVKCHPMVDPTARDQRGNDRPPRPNEIEKCLPFLKEQIAIIKPNVVVLLGATAARALLGRTEGISSLRGRFHDISLIEGHPPIPVLPTYHPAALLRDENLKKFVWEDMKLLRNKLNAE